MDFRRGSSRALLLYWLPVVLWAGVIFALSATPNLRIAEADTVDFGVLAILLWRALSAAGLRRSIVWSWLLAAAYAGSDEFHQSFTAGRHPALTDVAIDATGALIALCVLVVWLRCRR